MVVLLSGHDFVEVQAPYVAVSAVFCGFRFVLKLLGWCPNSLSVTQLSVFATVWEQSSTSGYSCATLPV